MWERSKKGTLAAILIGFTCLVVAGTLFSAFRQVKSAYDSEPDLDRRVDRDEKGVSGVDAPRVIMICEIQGKGFDSPFVDEHLHTQGLVVADFDQLGMKGFYLQDEHCDDDPSTSDGLFVYLGSRVDVVEAGDWVEVEGVVKEFYGQTELVTTHAEITVVSGGNPLPKAWDLNPPFENQGARLYFESLEGMLVGMEAARVVGPTSRAGETWVIRWDLAQERVFQDDPQGTGGIITLDDEGEYRIDTGLKVGDQILELTGALGYSHGLYRMHLTTAPYLPDSEIMSELDSEQPREVDRYRSTRTFPIRVATFNFENLFDTRDEPGKEDPVLTAAAYQRKLRKLSMAIHELEEPTLIAVQEVENQDVLDDLRLRSEIEAEYGIVWVDSPDVRGIDIALLFRTDQVKLDSYSAQQGCTTLLDGFGPDGNRDVMNPYNQITCDVDGDGQLDGNRLFSRPPLVIRLRLCVVSCLSGSQNKDELFTVIVNHWKSKTQDTLWNEYTLPRRVQQAEFVAGLVEEENLRHPQGNLIVIGDLNDFPDSEPIGVLTQSGLVNLVIQADPQDRYTYIHHGVSQVLDYLLIRSEFQKQFHRLRIHHFNADYPSVYGGVLETVYRSSDHDPIVAEFLVLTNRSYLPMGMQNR